MVAQQRKIVHLDCDCFYAAVEMRDDPSLRGRPIAVGGQPSRRGVVATCNYEARDYGVRSAMPTAHAMRLCPDLLVIPTNMEKYRQVAGEVRTIFHDYTDLVEPLSLDEAYLDVSGTELCKGSATLVAEEIRGRVFEHVGITISAGVAPNKFLAKVASDWRKPNGLYVITPKQVSAFVKELPVSKIPGVGKVTQRRLEDLGVTDCGQLQKLDHYQLVDRFGRFGERLFHLCRGEDDRQVVASRHRKSLSVERTYGADIATLEGCQKELSLLLERLLTRLEGLGDDYRIKSLNVKMKFSDFSQTTVEREGEVPRASHYLGLLQQAYERGGDRSVRLLGVGVRFSEIAGRGDSIQLSLL